MQAKAMNADLIVVGRSDRFRPLGRTALRVLRDEERAMLVVPTMDGIVSPLSEENTNRRRSVDRPRV